MAQEVLNYYEIGTKEDIVISSSVLKYIDPKQGGSPQAFINSFEKSNEEEKKWSRIGKMIHKWAEDKKNFHISAVPKPTEGLGVVADAMISWMKESGEVFSNELLFDITRKCNFQPKWRIDAIVKNYREQVEKYTSDVMTAEVENKIYLTADEAKKVEDACNAIQNHPVASELLFLQDNDFTDQVTLKEEAIFWKEEVNGVTLSLKALLDDVTINHEKKTVTINDLKSTSFGAYSYEETFKKFRTWRQLAFYRKAIIQWGNQKGFNLKEYKFDYHVIVVETNGDLVQCAVWEVSEGWIKYGHSAILKLLQRIAYHISTSDWNYSVEEKENKYKILLPFTEE